MEIKKKADLTGKIPNTWRYDAIKKSEGHTPLHAQLYKDLYTSLYV